MKMISSSQTDPPAETWPPQKEIHGMWKLNCNGPLANSTQEASTSINIYFSNCRNYNENDISRSDTPTYGNMTPTKEIHSMWKLNCNGPLVTRHKRRPPVSIYFKQVQEITIKWYHSEWTPPPTTMKIYGMRKLNCNGPLVTRHKRRPPVSIYFKQVQEITIKWYHPEWTPPPTTKKTNGTGVINCDEPLVTRKQEVFTSINLS